MTDTFQTTSAAIAETLQGIPGALIALALLALSVAVALALYAIVTRLARNFSFGHPVMRATLAQTAGPLRLAFVVFAMRVATAWAPVTPELSDILGRILQVAFIILVGWIVMVAADIASNLYLLRFRMDIGDNLLARKHVTQVRVLRRALSVLIIMITAAAALMSFEAVRQYGVSLFASAGIAGVVVGLAARPVLSNLIAGVQIAITQPIRIDDAVVIENEWGWIEEITATYVVIKLWDWRRLIVPLSYFMEKPFQNWTRETASIIGSVFIYTDYSVPVARMREKLAEIARASKLWDGNVVNLQVTDAKERTIELRALVSARTSPQAWDLRCEVREKLIAFLREEFPNALPRERAEVEVPSLAPHGDGREGMRKPRAVKI